MTRYHLPLIRRQLGLVLAIVCLVAPGTPVAQAWSAQPAPVTTPLLTDAAAASALGSAEVTGQHFSQGGKVYVALYDQWGVQLHETRWVTASMATFGANGSQDPPTAMTPAAVSMNTSAPSRPSMDRTAARTRPTDTFAGRTPTSSPRSSARTAARIQPMATSVGRSAALACAAPRSWSEPTMYRRPPGAICSTSASVASAHQTET